MASNKYPRASLLGLPQELVDTIVSKSIEDGDRSDLVDLSRTCSSLRAASLPLMYERISCSQNGFDEEELVDLLTESPFAVDVGQHAKTLDMQLLNPLDDTVYQIIERTNNLKHLYLYYHLKYDENGKGCCVHTERLSHALRHVDHSLVEMRIDYRFGNRLNEAMEWPESDLKHHPMDLRHLNALRALIIPTSILLGWRLNDAPKLGSILPQNLTTLKLLREHYREKENSKADVKVFENLVVDFVEGQSWVKWTPRLESICLPIGIWSGTEKDWKGRYDAMRRVLESNGLKFIENREGLIDWSTHWVHSSEADATTIVE